MIRKTNIGTWEAYCISDTHDMYGLSDYNDEIKCLKVPKISAVQWLILIDTVEERVKFIHCLSNLQKKEIHRAEIPISMRLKSKYPFFFFQTFVKHKITI